MEQTLAQWATAACSFCVEALYVLLSQINKALYMSTVCTCRIVMDGSPCASDDPFVFADALMRQVSHVLVGFVLAPSPGVRVHPSSCRVRIQAPSARVPMHPPPATLSPSDRSKVVAGRLILLAERYLGRAVKEGEYAIGGRQYLIKSQEVMAGDLNVHELFRLFAWKGPGGPTLNVSGYSAFEALSDMFATPAASPFPLIYMEADFMGPVAAAFMGLLRRPKDDQVSLAPLCKFCHVFLDEKAITKPRHFDEASRVLRTVSTCKQKQALCSFKASF